MIEFGSYDVNGIIRDLFSAAATYTGIDKRPGPGVDAVCNTHEAVKIGMAFDTVVCCEMLEHDIDPQMTVDSAFDVLVKGGLAIFTTRGIGYGLHDAPEDYWRFTQYGLQQLMQKAGFEDIEVIDHAESKGVFGFGFRKH